MMEKLTLSNVSLADLKQVVTLKEKPGRDHSWTDVSAIALTPNDQRQLGDVQNRLRDMSLHLLNEATIWSRAIYPLLLLAEQADIQAWAGVPLQTQYANFAIDGVADGALGRSLAGRMEAPYLVVIEAKRGVEAQSPIFQLYGQLLAAARLNWLESQQEPQEVFGCYTIADSWTFVRAEVTGMEQEKPTLTVEYSRELTEKVDAEQILKILKGIVGRHLTIEEQQLSPAA